MVIFTKSKLPDYPEVQFKAKDLVQTNYLFGLAKYQIRKLNNIRLDKLEEFESNNSTVCALLYGQLSL